MRCIVVGYGIQGRKRWISLGEDRAGIVEPDMKNSVAPWADVRDVPLDVYDAAMVCVPPDEKIAIIEHLIENKKHILVEKPLLGSDAQLRKIEGDCHRANVVCYVAYNHRFEPMIIKLKELIDSGDLGKLYHCRMFYGNGTAEDVRKSPWRDSGYGVLAEIGTHLIDISGYLFGGPLSFEMVSGRKYENKFMDHAVFQHRLALVHSSTRTGVRVDDSMIDVGVLPLGIECEVTYLSWKNTFTIDLIGSNGSAHLDGLTKWGVGKLTQRWRLRPPGVPYELTIETKRPDATWTAEYEHFKLLCDGKIENPGLARDRMINKTLEVI